MKITRRGFIKGSLAAACAGYMAADAWASNTENEGMQPIPGTGVRAGGSRALGGNVVVFVQLKGGNDGLNTVFPLDGQQRTLYEEYRPTLAVSNTVAGQAALAAAGFGGDAVYEIGTNADGTRYAFHPAIGALHELYLAGKLAVLPGIHYPFPNHSHFAGMGIWHTANPADTGSGGTGGWFGRYLDAAGFQSTDLPAVMMGGGLDPMFVPTEAGLFAFRRLNQLTFPASGETALKSATYERICDIVDDLDPSSVPELVKIAQTGKVTVQHMMDFYLPGNGLEQAGKVEALLLDSDGKYNVNNLLVYDSPLNAPENEQVREMDLNRDLRHVAAMIRAGVGPRFYHVDIGGFDTHSNQENGFDHSFLLQEVSESVAAFYRDMDSTVALPGGYAGYETGVVSDNVLVVIFSEFGRTLRQNATQPDRAGTDHAAASVQFVLGGNVIGGQYGVYPQLANPRVDRRNDLRMTTDFRDMFGTILTRHLTVPAADVGPGVGKILPATPQADSDGNSYTAFTPMGFLPG